MDPLSPDDPDVLGPFRLSGRIGAGGMGQVYLGRSTAGDEQLVAVKVIHPGFASDAQFRARFTREIVTAGAITAPWVARVVDADPGGPRPWLATEYVAGPALDQAVRDSGPLDEARLAQLAHRLAQALVGLHAAGVVHRDLKPSNVLLADDGPRLIDFGIARAIDATVITSTGFLIGTPAFMSPEQVLGDETGPPSDVFSLASVLVFAAAGSGPFGDGVTPVAMLRRVADTAPELAGVPVSLRPAIEACLSKDPAARPTAEELVARLAPPAPIPPPTMVMTRPLEQPHPGAQVGRRLLIGAVIAAGVAVISVLTVMALTAGGRVSGSAPVVAGPEPVHVRLGTAPNLDAIAFSRDGGRAYLANQLGVDVIDMVDHRFVRTLDASRGPASAPMISDVAITPDGSRAYVSNLDEIVVVDTATGLATTRIQIDTQKDGYPDDVAVTPDGRGVLVSHLKTDVLSLIDTGTNTITKRAELLGRPLEAGESVQILDLPRDGHRAFVDEAGRLAAVDLSTLTVSERTPDDTAVVLGDTGACTLGGRCYVSGVDEIREYEAGAARPAIPLKTTGFSVEDVAVSPDAQTIYALMKPVGSANTEARIAVVDLATRTVRSFHTIGPRAESFERLHISPDGRQLVRIRWNNPDVEVYDTAQLR